MYYLARYRDRARESTGFQLGYRAIGKVEVGLFVIPESEARVFTQRWLFYGTTSVLFG